jgi:hypothetical protein
MGFNNVDKMVTQSITISNSQVSNHLKNSNRNKAISVRSVTKQGQRQHIIIRDLPKDPKEPINIVQNCEYTEQQMKKPLSTLRPPSTGATF